MNIAVAADKSHRAIIEHCRTATHGMTEKSEVLIVENPLIGAGDIPTLNTCVGVIGVLRTKELMLQFREAHGFVQGYPKTLVYGMLGQTGFGDLMEMTFSTRLFAGGIGPHTVHTIGAGIACGQEVFDALQGLRMLEDTLLRLGYAGEVAIGVTENFSICNIWFGHFTPGFVLHTELGAQHPQVAFEMCAYGDKAPKLHQDRIALSTLLSYPPFPYDTTQSVSVKAPAEVEKHLFRVQIEKAEVAYASAWGITIQEAKRRCRRTIDRCQKYNQEIQYRFDYGWKEEFLLTQEKYLALGGR